MDYPPFSSKPRYSDPLNSFPQYSIVGGIVIIQGFLQLVSSINKGLLRLISSSKQNTLYLNSSVNKGELNLQSRIQILQQ